MQSNTHSRSDVVSHDLTPVLPAIETALWRSRSFAEANGASFLYGLALYAWLLVGALYLTQQWGYAELEAGLAMTPDALTAAAAAIAMGPLPATQGRA